MKTTAPRVYVVVVNWENFADTKECLSSVLGSGYSNLRVIIVDNGSRDGSIEQLRREFPNEVFLQTGSNLGFARGCNLGLRKALSDRECAFVMLLNNDATIVPGGLARAVAFFGTNARLGALSGKILTSREEKTIWYAGGRIHRWRGQAIVRGFGEKDDGQFDQACEVGFVTGAMMLVRREVLEAVGLLPEEYFFGIEEWDFSLQVTKGGYQLFYFPELVGYHKADGSHWNYDPKFVYNAYRNKLIFQEKYLPSPLFRFWKILFGMYGRYRARSARQRLIEKRKFDLPRPVQFDDLDYALARAIQDHGTNVMSESVLSSFEQELRARNRAVPGFQ
jgi:GT2 family glycosyltransferase